MGVCQINHVQASSLVLHLEKAGLTPEDAAGIIEERSKSRAKAMVEVVKPQFVTPLHDDEVPEPLTKYLEPWHRMAFDEFDRYCGPVAYRVKAGCRLAEDCPGLGPCHKDWAYLAEPSWAWKNDEPTKDGIVFFIPRIVPWSTSKTADAQMALLGNLRTKHGLPSHHLASFGSAALDAALILAHHKRTDDRIPENQLWVRTDTFLAGGSRLGLGRFDECGLGCAGWDWDGVRLDCLGCFALGVEVR